MLDPELAADDVGSANAALQRLQNLILVGVASGQTLKAIMDLLCREVEGIAPAVICSVVSVDPLGHVHPIACPSLGDDYANAIDGLSVGPRAGSCGTAAYRGEPVEVTDIATDPLWEDYRSLVLPLGLAACWSTPIRARDGEVIGTFAFYYRTPRGPSDFDRRIVETCVHLSAIAIEHENAQLRIQELAFLDALTGLPNRACFRQHAAEVLDAAARSGELLAIHYIDLDAFKDVNDTLGHWIGDLLLGQVAHRVQSCLSRDEIITRLGGDEFAIIQTRPRDREDVCGLAGELVALFAEPFDIEDHEILIGASIGIVCAPDDGTDLINLLKKADLALYRAKNEGRGTYRMFEQEMFERVQARRILENDLRQALARSEFELVFQPIVAIGTCEIVSAEVLVRWNHPTRGTISPIDFIPIAEETGLIVDLGEWIFRQACREAATWPSHIRVAVNLSPIQLRKETFGLDVVSVLEETGLPAGRLDFEITETVPLNADAGMRHTLFHLKQLGIRIALDDFGTGYSSLSYLASFPFDRIKIDKSFVGELDQREDATSIVRAILGLAEDLGMSTTAEGVETADQLVWLAQRGCTEGQGYYFSRPLSRRDFRKLIARQSLVLPAAPEAAVVGDRPKRRAAAR